MGPRGVVRGDKCQDMCPTDLAEGEDEQESQVREEKGEAMVGSRKDPRRLARLDRLPTQDRPPTPNAIGTCSRT